MELRQVLKMYLDLHAHEDTEFATAYKNEKKSLDECLLFIQKTMYDKAVKNAKEEDKGSSVCIVPSDDEIFSLAVRYYMDADLVVEGTSFDNIKMYSLCATTFTDKEKEDMRQEAIKKYQEDIVNEAKKRDDERKKKGKKTAPVIVPDVKETTDEEEKKDNKGCVIQQLSLDF